MADRVFDCANALGEGPFWDAASNALYWVDLLGKMLFKGDPGSGVFESQSLPYAASRVTSCDDGKLLVSFLRRPAFGSFGSADYELMDLAALGTVRQRFNDGACDTAGRFWTATYDGDRNSANGRLVAIEGDLISVKAEGIRMPNGIRWSPDEKVMYFVDSWPGQVWSYEFNVNDGVLGKRRLFLDYEGSGVKPDGCVVDEEGCLWIAEVNRSRVARYSPSGKLDSEVLVPTGKPTSVSFGGSDRRTLYITSRTDGLSDAELAAQPEAGAVFAARVSTPGLPEQLFRRASVC
jgi:sugar lactone lactonase YvrE